MDDEEELTREIYAQFGLACYTTECVFRGLLNIFAFLPFTPDDAPRSRVEEMMKRAEAMTMGELATATRLLMPEELGPTLDWAVTQRNFLAHGYWHDRTHLMSTSAGMIEMLDELQRTYETMKSLNTTLSGLMNAHFARIGVTPDMISSALEQSRNEPPSPLPAGRLLKVGERLAAVRAWRIRNAEGLSTPLIEDNSGAMWQLSDVGLSLSSQSRPDETWSPFEQLNAFLPAEIVARPKGGRPWEYKLHVSTGAFIVVARHATAGFTFAVERKS